LIENFKISLDVRVKISRKRKKNNLKRRNYLKRKKNIQIPRRKEL